MKLARVTGEEGIFRVIRRGEQQTRVIQVGAQESRLVASENVEEIPPESPDVQSLAASQSQSAFRRWMAQFLDAWGANPEWPALLSWLLEAEFRRQQLAASTYPSKVFINRDEEVIGRAEECDAVRFGKWSEERLTQALYDRCHFGSTTCPSTAGRFTIDTDAYWLLGYEFPTCNGPADLVALTVNGGLAVFECKGAVNSYSPFGAILEGLDYLSSLTSEGNFAKLSAGFAQWRSSLPAERVPGGFEETSPTRDATHIVIVLAPQEYFDRYSRSSRGFGCGEENSLGHWRNLSSYGRRSPTSVRFGLAACDFLRTTSATWLGAS